jgi:hypothetical protein
MSQFTVSSDLYSASHTRQKDLLNSIVNYLIVCGNLSISTVEQKRFNDFMKAVDSKFSMPSHRKVHNMINSSFDNLRGALNGKLAEADAVSLTLDMWSD